MALRKIDLMHRVFGKCPGHACRECSNLIKGSWGYSKCKVYGNTHSQASDWTKRWEACGHFNKPWDDKPIMRLVRPTRKDKEEMQNTPLDGQVSMEV